MLFLTRYYAKKEIETNPFYSSSDKIVKVCGGYTIMTAEQYAKWRKQK